MDPSTKEDMTLTFREKSKDYPGGRIALLSDGRVVFPELRFTPEVGKKYTCRVCFYERRDSVIGIALPNGDRLSETEYLRDPQVVISITFVSERGSDLVARHPISGAYIVPTDVSERQIKEGITCWVAVIQRGTSLYADFIKNDEGEEKPPEPATALASYDPSFAASAEQTLLAKRGMGKPPVFQYGGKQSLPWEILGIPREAETNKIKAAYKSLSKNLHPDKKPGGNREDFLAIAHAHDWMTFRRQWIDEISEKLATRQIEQVVSTKAGPAETSAKPPTTESKPPPAKKTTSRSSRLNTSINDLDPKGAKKLASLAGNNGQKDAFRLADCVCGRRHKVPADSTGKIEQCPKKKGK